MFRREFVGVPDGDWAARARDGALLVTAIGLLVAETAGQVFWARPADLTIVGAALALLGIIPKIGGKGD